MPTYKKLNGALAIASNTYGAPTGYGVQTKLLTDKLLKHGVQVAILSNYGLEARFDEIKTANGVIKHYPKGLKPYSDDVIPLWYQHFMAQHPNRVGKLFTLYDVWVYNELAFDEEIISWVPLDHVTTPPGVMKFLQRDNVSPVAMSPFGHDVMNSEGIENTYIPHAVDTKVFKPTAKAFGQKTRELLDVPEDAFLVSMVSANKANKFVHRKALAENLVAFSKFLITHPDAYLYLHMEPGPAYGGFDLSILLKAVGLTDKNVRILDPDQNRVGYPDEALAAFYSASDVLLAASYGEGFQVPLIEAQACGTRVIASNWTAPKDLVSDDSFLVEGQPFWDNPQASFFYIPAIGSIYGELEQAYNSERGTNEASIEFASAFDIDKVWQERWLPFWEEKFDAA